MGTEAFVVEHVDDVDAVVRGLAEHGIVVIPDYLGKDHIVRAAAECQVLFEQTPDWAHHEDYSVGQAVRMEREDMDPDRFGAVKSALESPRIEKITEQVFGDGYLFSRTIYAILDVVGSRTHVQQLHYDKMRHLKSFIYLSDVGPDNGPFHCVPGSHRVAQQQEAANRANRIVPEDADVRRLPPDLTERIVPVVGNAGTLILFDSDIAHYAGIVRSGSRLAIRSLSFGAYREEVWRRKDGTLELPA